VRGSASRFVTPGAPAAWAVSNRPVRQDGCATVAGICAVSRRSTQSRYARVLLNASRVASSSSVDVANEQLGRDQHVRTVLLPRQRREGCSCAVRAALKWRTNREAPVWLPTLPISGRRGIARGGPSERFSSMNHVVAGCDFQRAGSASATIFSPCVSNRAMARSLPCGHGRVCLFGCLLPRRVDYLHRTLSEKGGNVTHAARIAVKVAATSVGCSRSIGSIPGASLPL
jgi:hypothetical protein